MTSIQANGYNIHFNDKAYNSLNTHISEKKYSSIYLIVDENSNEHCAPKLLSALATEIPIEIIEIESGESSKNIETCIEIWRILTDFGADKKCLILNLGGGVITDLGGFIASTYKRGVDFINIPTSLLAMVDASIGGKNGIDLDHLKNQIGTVTVPQMIVIDSGYLETLPQNQMRSGLAEMLKHGLIADRNYWERFFRLNEIDFSEFDDLIYKSILIKNQIVTEDPKENGIRKSLNFGHTIGHALESYFNINSEKKPLLHGEAIAIGMVLEAFISKEKKLISIKEFEEIEQTIFSVFPTITLNEEDILQVINLLKYDKKNEYGNIHFSLLNNIGMIKINQTVDNGLIYRSLEKLKS